MPFLKPDEPLTPALIKKYIEYGQERANRKIAKPENKHTHYLAALFVETHLNCFFRSTRNCPDKITANERAQMLQTAITTGATLCAIAHKIRQASDKQNAVKILYNGNKNFFLHHTQGQLHPLILKWLDVHLTATTCVNRAEIINALREMFPPPTPRTLLHPHTYHYARQRRRHYPQRAA